MVIVRLHGLYNVALFYRVFEIEEALLFHLQILSDALNVLLVLLFLPLGPFSFHLDASFNTSH